MLVTWPAQNFGGPKLMTLGDQQYFVWDTASQSRKLRDMQKKLGGMTHWLPKATPRYNAIITSLVLNGTFF